jgi:hypothetical protein
MKAAIIISVLVLPVLFAAGPIAAQNAELEMLYRARIDQKIEQWAAMAAREGSTSQWSQNAVRAARDHALFYEVHKEQLVKAMVDQKIGTRDHQIDYFLVKAYRDHLTALLAQTSGVEETK